MASALVRRSIHLIPWRPHKCALKDFFGVPLSFALKADEHKWHLNSFPSCASLRCFWYLALTTSKEQLLPFAGKNFASSWSQIVHLKPTKLVPLSLNILCSGISWRGPQSLKDRRDSWFSRPLHEIIKPIQTSKWIKFIMAKFRFQTKSPILPPLSAEA